MIQRERYIRLIREFYDSDLIKIITGIRRCGKSVILREIREEIGSVAFARTEKVMKLLEDLGAVPLNYPMTELLRKNSSYAHQTPTTALRHELFSYAVKHPDTIIERLEQLTHLSPMQRRYYKICTFVRKIFGMI